MSTISGTVLTDFQNTGRDEVWSVTVQPDGKIVAGGYSNGFFALARYNSNGSLDTSFNGTGKVLTNLVGYGHSVTLQGDGKIVLTGQINVGNDSDFALTRYNPDGSLDTTFNATGTARTGFGSLNEASRGVAIQNDGKIVVGGYSGDDFALARYDSDGSLDTSFNGTGKVLTDFASSSADYALSVHLQSDGKIVLAGQSLTGGISHFAVARYNTDGSLDATFNGTGKVLTDFGGTNEAGYDVTVQSDGKIVVGGYSDGRFALARYNSDGSLDMSFHGTGKVVTDFGTSVYGFSITLLSDGKIIVAGYSNPYGGNNDFALARYNSDGSLDASFNGSGKVLTDFGGGTSDWGYDVTVQSDGKIVVGGHSNEDFALARYNVDGSLDTTFTGAMLNSPPSGIVTITGTPLQGETLTAANTLADVDGLGTISYQWQADGTNIAGATGSTFVLTQAQVGHTIDVVASYTDGGGTAESVTSAATTAVVRLNTAPVASTSSVFMWTTPEDTVTSGWISTGAGYRPIFGSLYSDADGDAFAGVALTANQTTSAQGTWQYSTDGGIDAWFTIPTNLSLTNALVLAAGTPLLFIPALNFNGQAPALTAYLADASVGGLTTGATVNLTATGTGGSTPYSSSPVTISQVFTPVNDSPTGAVTISGTPLQGQTLTAANTLSDVDGLGAISYQWQADSANIVGATGRTLVLGQAEVGKTITVVASYTDGGGTVESVTSSATDPVANINDPPQLADTTDPAAIVESAGSSWSDLAPLTGSFAVTDADASDTLTAQVVGAAVVRLNAQPFALPGSAAGLVGQGVFTLGSVTAGPGDRTVAYTYDPTTAGLDFLGQGETLTITYTVQVQDGSAASNTQDVTFTITGTNDAPSVLAAQVTYDVSEDGAQLSGDQPFTDDYPDTSGHTVVPVTSYVYGTNAPAKGVLTASVAQEPAAGGSEGNVHWSYTLAPDAYDLGPDQQLIEVHVLRVLDQYGAWTTMVRQFVVHGTNDSPTGTVTISGTAAQGQTLTASNTLADADGLGPISYQWEADGANIVGATGSTLVLGQAEVGKTISVVASYTDGGGTAESVSSETTGSVTDVNDAPTGSVTIGGFTGTAPQRGDTLTAANTLVDPDGIAAGAITYEWRAGADVLGTGATLAVGQALVGKAITVVASYIDGASNSETVTSAATEPVVGISDPGTTNLERIVTFDGIPVTGTGPGYVRHGLVSEDGLVFDNPAQPAENKFFEVVPDSFYFFDGEGVLGLWAEEQLNITRPAGGLFSPVSIDVDSINFDGQPEVTFTGIDAFGHSIVRSFTTDFAAGLQTVSLAGMGDLVSLSVTYVANRTNIQIDNFRFWSENHAPTGSLTIGGFTGPAPKQGDTLTVSNDFIDPEGVPASAITYEWKADTEVVGTGSSFVLGQGQVGKTITVVASYTDLGDSAESVSSAATAAVANINDSPSGSVSISGTAAQGQTLTASNSLVDPDGIPAGGISYQWQAGGANIVGATGSTLVLGQAEVGKTITVVASYTDLGGSAESMSSAGTAAVANINDSPSGSVSISGTAAQGQTLTASNSLVDPDGIPAGGISYQWQAGGVNIVGATGSTLVLGQPEVGKTITVVASYTDQGGTAESVTSTATAAVANVNDAPTGSVTISGTAAKGQTLTANNSLADADGLGVISYQWKADGAAIAGATSSMFVLQQAQVGKQITVVASYTDLGGTAETVTSGATAPVSNSAAGAITTGTDGDDVLSSTSGGALAGGLGNDTYLVSSSSTTIIEYPNQGIDLVQSSVTHTLAANVENLTLTGTAKINGIGNNLANVLVGNSSDNVLTAGLGADTITGGAGADRFAYTSTADSGAQPGAWDILTDFVAAQGDRIDLSAIDLNPARNGRQGFTSFLGSAAFSSTDATGQLRFDAATHMLYGSTNADSAPEFAIELTGVTVLTAANLVL